MLIWLSMTFTSHDDSQFDSQSQLQAATRKARLMGDQLATGKFQWSDWIEVSLIAESIGTWLERFERSHWEKTKRTDAALTTWKDYRLTFNRLDGDRALTTETLVEAIVKTEPDSRTRKKVCTYFYKLATFAKLEGTEAIKELAGNYSPTSVQPRNLPTDSAIAQYRESIKSDAWRWLFGVLATYGVRSHEVFRLNWEDFPIVRVLSGKTGKRFVYPLYPEWADDWKLKEVNLPELDLNYSNAKLGSKVSGWFYDRKVPFKAYDLRHCYARRCFEFGLAPDWSAGLMGHSLSVHLNTYRAKLGE
ncbi:integrase [Scytonema hofmannii FACHB-248]|uniref:Integrase n=1 Tax=Scytonema hofmannii FACHB-248 TaxID=1842502 RepID=A0ABR8GYI2_9CYAN|nr:MULTISPECIES: integrase [Nostocales]MBD2607828.1 integrase [Scytonema hofmannii FACHB-248]